MDREDPLRGFREKFHYPDQHRGKKCIYLCGNSLGLQPKSTREHINKELERWQLQGVEGWFDKEDPWVTYAETLSEPMARIVGAEEHEVAVMNSLTVNLHLILSAFYKPTKERYKILIESDAFPSDRYAFESQVGLHGFDPVDGILEVTPDEGTIISTEKINKVISERGHEIAIVLLGGVNYYTGQWFDIPEITRSAHNEGCLVGWDLAHAAGNVPLNLHGDDVDFAAWCNYKYLNSGPGSIAGVFIHERFHGEAGMPGLAGWWGQKLDSRFNMRKPWDPAEGAKGWVISTPTILALASVRSSLAVFEEAGMPRIREKSVRLTGYLEYLLSNLQTDRISLITPKDPTSRGAQLSIRVNGADKNLFETLSNKGIVADWREPDVIRVAPAPLYNSYMDVGEFVEILEDEI